MSHPLVGLVPLGSTVRDDYQLFHSRCDYKVLDVYTIADIVQDYFSKAIIDQDVDYVFPLPPGAVVCSFQSVLDDVKVIEGIIKAKKVEGTVKEHGEAEDAEADDARTQGNFPPPEQEHANVFRIHLGNIKPKQKISVHISFVSIVPHDASSPRSFRITLPTAIASRHGAAPDIPWPANMTRHQFELTISIQTNDSIISINSPSHPVNVILGRIEREPKYKGSYEPSTAFIYLEHSIFLDKDIIIEIFAEGLDGPRCNVERWHASEGAEETTDAYALTVVPDFDIPALPSQEYIFLVDRSGSMRGGRMAAVKTALQIMLRSLPSQNTSLNIVSFDSHYFPLWSKSQVYNADTVTQASKCVDTFTAGYAGTGLCAAMRFAFSSPINLDASLSGEKPATSVFLLTDGEAWDLDGIADLVAENFEAAKKQGKLLRTFVLGVGNQVSTAVCEAIARAGKGSAVFVAEGERAGAKLMSLLKAARGGVIEDFAVEWSPTVSPPYTSDESEDLSGSSEAKSTPPESSSSGSSEAKSPPPESSHHLHTQVEEQPVVNDTESLLLERKSEPLPPPPVIQQAPESHKLPVPLYPGFRCSIFAIIKQSQNPGPHSPTVTVSGMVQGRQVTFKTPVIPVAVRSGATSNAPKGSKLLHTLAAKALIEIYDAMPCTPEATAQIERLQKRYSLASSVTSFLAIDQEIRSKTPILTTDKATRSDEHMAKLSGTAKWQATLAGGLSTQSTATFSPQPTVSSSSNIAYVPPQRPRLRALRSSSTPQSDSASGYLPTLFGFVRSQSLGDNNISSSPITASILGPTGYGPTISSSTVHSLGRNDYGTSRDPPPKYTYDTTVDDAQLIRDNVSKYLEHGEPYESLTSESDFLSLSPSFNFDFASKKRSIAPPSLLDRMASNNLAATIASPPHPLVLANYSTFTDSVPTIVGPVTLELMARVQQFDGSFPSDPAFLAQICENRPFSAMPLVLSALGVKGDGDTRKITEEIWVTVLTLACLKYAFMLEKDSWEIMAEKATVFVETALKAMFPANDHAAVHAALIADAGTQF